jgi:hypothetical protein
MGEKSIGFEEDRGGDHRWEHGNWGMDWRLARA